LLPTSPAERDLTGAASPANRKSRGAGSLPQASAALGWVHAQQPLLAGTCTTWEEQ